MINASDKKKTIVFLHGWGGRIKTWDDQVAFFKAQGFEVLAMKMPGFDLPEPSPDWGIPEYADFVISKLPDKNSRYIFVGHSFGGRVATYIACYYPKFVDRLVLTDSAGINIEPHPGRRALIALSQSVRALEKRIQVIESLRSIARNVLGSKNFRDASPVMREVMKEVVNLDLQDCLPKIKARTLIVWGDQDKTTPLNMAYTFNRGIQGSSLKLIKGAGHSPHSTHTKEWNEIVNKFLSS